MKTLHTPEPWRVGALGYIEAGAETIADMLDFYSSDMAEANARRIVACVNRLASFTTEQIEDAGFDLAGTAEWVAREQRVLEQLRKMEAQRNQLLAALAAIKQITDGSQPIDPAGAAMVAASAIAAVKESK